MNCSANLLANPPRHSYAHPLPPRAASKPHYSLCSLCLSSVVARSKEDAVCQSFVTSAEEDFFVLNGSSQNSSKKPVFAPIRGLFPTLFGQNVDSRRFPKPLNIQTLNLRNVPRTSH